MAISKYQNFIFLFILLSFGLDSFAQRKYVVYLKDKANSGFDLASPLSMISQRALDRRTRQTIAMDSTDIPVNENYINQIELTGALVIRKSKWLNAVVVDCDSSTLQQILTLPFVINNQRIFKVKQPAREFPETPIDIDDYRSAKTKTLNYGAATNQIRMLGADEMHDDGFTGDGIWVGVFDSGFRNVDTLNAFEDMRNSNRLLGTYDIVEGDSNVFDEHTHGTSVLSCMTAYLPGQIIGTGFGASYILFRTEDVFSETQLEEFNWLVAAEMADSIGVDIINTSLGYTTMDNSLFSHSYADMDGKTTIIARASLIAARKGILCVTSAGNEGGNSWFYISSPADADSIISVGAVQGDSSIAGFSSRGPSFDGRIKPNVVAQGQGTTVVNSSTGQVVKSSGTSFSGPLIAGFAAGLWQANPDLSNIELIELIQMSADRSVSPNNEYGYGIPNYGKAKFLSALHKASGNSGDVLFFPNPIKEGQFLTMRVNENVFRRKLKIEFFNAVGSMISSYEFTPNELDNVLPIEITQNNKGLTLVRVSSDLGTQVYRIINE